MLCVRTNYVGIELSVQKDNKKPLLYRHISIECQYTSNRFNKLYRQLDDDCQYNMSKAKTCTDNSSLSVRFICLACLHIFGW